MTVATVFENGLSSKFHQVVFEPLTDPAAQAARNYAFGYESDSQTVQIRGVHVYRADGTIDDSFDTATFGANDPSSASYTSEASFRVRFPRLNAGDVVELQYRVEDVAERNAFADYFGDIDYLQSTEPVARGEYVLITPKKRTFYFNKPTIPVAQTVEEKGDQRIYPIRRDRHPRDFWRSRSSRRSRSSSATSTSRRTKVGTRWALGIGASSKINSSQTKKFESASPKSPKAKRPSATK